MKTTGWVCKSGHPMDDAYQSPSGKIGCRVCLKNAHRAWRDRNPDKLRERAHRYRERKRREGPAPAEAVQ